MSSSERWAGKVTEPLSSYRNQARELDAGYRAQAETVRRDEMLSERGKREQLERIEAQRKAAVAQLQEGARTALIRRKAEVDKALAEARAAAVEQRRALLGDSLVADLYRRRLEMLTPEEITRWAHQAAAGWERAVLVEYGSLELDKRTQTAKGVVDAGTIQARRTLAEMDAPAAPLAGLEQEARDLADVDRLVLGLDGGAYRAHVAAVAGVTAAHVPY